MKNLTLFVVIALSFLGTPANAQSYTIRWHDAIGSNNVTAVADYSNFDQPMRRRIYRHGGGAANDPIWIPIQEDTLGSGSGVDNISLNTGGRIQIRILNDNSAVVLVQEFIQNILVPPTQTVHDVIYGQPPSISLRMDVHAPYGLGRDNHYLTKLHCRLERTSPSDYEQTITFTYPINVVPIAYFELPFEFFGDYCFEWYITDEDVSINSHFGETVVWESGLYCFSYDISTGFQSEALKAEFGSYPNPFTDIVTIVSPSEVDYRVTNLAGQNVASGKLFVGDNRVDVLSGLMPGMYILETSLGSTKLIKQ